MNSKSDENHRRAEFIKLESGCSFGFLEWAQVFRESLARAAESFEFDGTHHNQLTTLRDLVEDVTILARQLPMPIDPVDPLDVVPLQRLLEALTVIGQGRPDELLDPRTHAHLEKAPGKVELSRKHGRRRSDVRQIRVRAYGIAFRSLFEKAAVDKTRANKSIAEAFTAAGLTGHMCGDVVPNTVQTWCRMAGSGTRDEDARLAKEFEATLKTQMCDHRDPAEIERLLVRMAQDLAKR